MLIIVDSLFVLNIYISISLYCIITFILLEHLYYHIYYFILAYLYKRLLISGRAERSSAANLYPRVRFSLGSKQRQ